MFVVFYNLLHSLSLFKNWYGFNFICAFFPLYQHIQNNAASFSWFSDDRDKSDLESILIWLLIQQTNPYPWLHPHSCFLYGGPPNSLAAHFSCVSWFFQICAYNENQGDLMHFLELKSSAFQYPNMECLSELCLLSSQGCTLHIKDRAEWN